MSNQIDVCSDKYLYNNLGSQQYKYDDTWSRPGHSQNIASGKGKKTKLEFYVTKHYS